MEPSLACIEFSIDGSKLLTELTWSSDNMSEINRTASIQFRSYLREDPGTVKYRELFMETFRPSNTSLWAWPAEDSEAEVYTTLESVRSPHGPPQFYD
jgi:hypothetical protein